MALKDRLKCLAYLIKHLAKGSAVRYKVFLLLSKQTKQPSEMIHFTDRWTEGGE